MQINTSISRRIEKSASAIILIAGSNLALILCFCLILLWVIDGFFAHFSQKWESLISTASSVITILMVFLIQKSQNKHSLAIQLKLNELVAAHEFASNRLVNVEGMTEDELLVLQKYYAKLSEFTKRQGTLTESHSIDEKHREHAIRQELDQELKNISDSRDIVDSGIDPNP